MTVIVRFDWKIEMSEAKFSDLFAETLVELGYTHCFFVAGGNVMHLIESLSQKLQMVPVINEVATVIAAEYFNEVSRLEKRKSLALVTAGPGITNALTGIAGAFTESREVLIVGGQVKRSDLSRGRVRQRGIQEIDGVALCESVCLRTLRIEVPIPRRELAEFVFQPASSRKGPIFLEICLDAQNALIETEGSLTSADLKPQSTTSAVLDKIEAAAELLRGASRPVLLLGSGVDLDYVPELLELTKAMGLPILSSWNGADRVPATAKHYFGRPNNWGQRHSNLIIQQADVLIAAGTRLGFQQTGFNYEEFAPLAKIVQIDIDPAEISKGHPRVDIGISCDAAEALRAIFESRPVNPSKTREWLSLCNLITQSIPVPDPENYARDEYVEVFKFVHELSRLFGPEDVIVPCSSGGGSTVTMQVVQQKGLPQRIVTNKGMASMGYGLPGTIGAAFARPESTIWLVDGDGGLTQNSQELGVIGQFQLAVKIFVISNNGYASIRSTQRNYFGGHYVGCDPSTGLHLPDWNLLAATYGVGYHLIDRGEPFSTSFLAAAQSKKPVIFEIPVDPEQTFYPKIQSRISATKGMESNPLHEMTPLLDRELMQLVAPHLKGQTMPQ
jgi:acetolactate synthase-1/2/3 large subunit